MTSKKDGSLLVLLGAFCFSGSGTIQAFSPEGANPFTVGALRLLVAGFFLILYCTTLKKFTIPKNIRPIKFLFSAIALASFQITFFLGVRDAGVAVGTVVTIGMTPITAAVFGLIFFKEVPKTNWYISTTIAITGLILLNIQGMNNFSATSLAFPIIAGTIYAFYLSQSKELIQENDPILIMTWLFIASSILLIPIWILFPYTWIFTPQGIIVGLGLGILTTALAYCLVMTGLKNCDTAKAATLSLGEPLGAAILGFTVLQEPISPSGLLGIILIFLSVVVLIYTPKMLTKRQTK